MDKNLNEFYFDILNIGKNNDIDKIKLAVVKERKILESKNISETGLCKVLSNLIYNDLRESNIACSIINTFEIFGCYEHEFVLASTKKEGKINYVLIDLTYGQFSNNGDNTLNRHFKHFPSEYLSKTVLLEELLNQGYSFVDEEKFQEYLYSIHQDKKAIGKFTLDDVLLKNYDKLRK